MIVKRFICPCCRKLLQTGVSRIRITCPACGAQFAPRRYWLAMKKGVQVEPINQVMHRSGN